jgi:hypothetical protein
MLRKMLLATVATLALGVATSAQAVNVNPLADLGGGIRPNAAALGTAAVAPYVTDTAIGDLMTAVLVTNALSVPIALELVFIDGEEDGDWNAPSLPPCIMSPRETTALRFTPSGSDTVVDYECSNTVFDPSQTAFPPLNGLNTQNQTVLDNSQKGFVVILARAVTGNGTPGNPVSIATAFTLQPNALVVDWTVIDYAAGEAYSAEAFHFQDVTVSTANGEIALAFLQVPAVSATNLIIPDCTNRLNPATCDVDVELILVPMDGRLNEPPMQTVNLDVWNDDELNVDRKHDYKCFDILRLAELDSRFLASSRCPTVAGFDTAPNGCVGHLELTNLLTTGGDQHDVINGDGNFIRISATIAWIVHRFRPLSALNPAPTEILNYDGATVVGIQGRASTARLFVTSVNPIVPFGGDPLAAVINVRAVLNN